MDVAEIVFHFLKGGGRFQVEPGSVALHIDIEVLAGAFADDSLHVGKIFDRLAVNGDHDIAFLKSGGGGGAAACTESTRALMDCLP